MKSNMVSRMRFRENALVNRRKYMPQPTAHTSQPNPPKPTTHNPQPTAHKPTNPQHQTNDPQPTNNKPSSPARWRGSPAGQLDIYITIFCIWRFCQEEVRVRNADLRIDPPSINFVFQKMLVRLTFGSEIAPNGSFSVLYMRYCSNLVHMIITKDKIHIFNFWLLYCSEWLQIAVP